MPRRTAPPPRAATEAAQPAAQAGLAKAQQREEGAVKRAILTEGEARAADVRRRPSRGDPAAARRPPPPPRCGPCRPRAAQAEEGGGEGEHR